MRRALASILAAIAPLTLLATVGCVTAGCSGDASVDEFAHEDDEEMGDTSEDALSPGVAVPTSLGLERRGTFYLTFDDGPSTAYTPGILDVLKKHGVHATFFVTGARIKGGEAIIKREKAEGHNVANHQWSHVNASISQFKAWVPKERDLLDEVLGDKEPRLFRYPYGAGNVAKEELLRGWGYKDGGVGWNLDSLDWCYASTGTCSRATNNKSNYTAWVLGEAKRLGGGVILQHDIQKITANNLDTIITSLETSGYKFGELPTEGR
jgi:peptidoglycan/xylan/chitin deacetylase (PgdA/CDA1 family)